MNLSILVPVTVASVLAGSLLLLRAMGVFFPDKEKLGDEVMRGDKIMPESKENTIKRYEEMSKEGLQNCFINRELSWLKFNERVLEEADDENNPLCERLTFLSIFQSNLDEFFMVRMGSLHDMMLLKKEIRENKTRMTPLEQFSLCLSDIRRMLVKRDEIYKKQMKNVSEYGISIVPYAQLNANEKKYMKHYFSKELEPLLSTIVVGRKQPFPFLNNKDLYIVAELRKKNDKAKIGIIPCNTSLMKRLVQVPEKPGVYVLTEDIILNFTSKVFKKYDVKSCSVARVTRNADIDADRINDEELDYREHMAEV
ncbi:MAG: hypothetical protein ACI4HL_04995, partial [Ruminococcus sp.]